MKNRHARKILDILSEEYPDPQSELDFRNSYQLLVAVALSAQCTDKKVNEVTPHLFRRFKDFQELSRARLSSVEKIIRPINYYKTKSRNLIVSAKLVTEKFNGEIPLRHEELIELPGVGRKTANVILGELGITETLPVDTHVMRVSSRLGLADGKGPLQVEDQLSKIYDKSLWRRLHHSLILHGRRICKAQSPRCDACMLNSLCPKIGVRQKGPPA